MQQRGCVPGHRNMGLLEVKGDLGAGPCAWPSLPFIPGCRPGQQLLREKAVKKISVIHKAALGTAPSFRLPFLSEGLPRALSGLATWPRSAEAPTPGRRLRWPGRHREPPFYCSPSHLLKN